MYLNGDIYEEKRRQFCHGKYFSACRKLTNPFKAKKTYLRLPKVFQET